MPLESLFPPEQPYAPDQTAPAEPAYSGDGPLYPGEQAYQAGRSYSYQPSPYKATPSYGAAPPYDDAAPPYDAAPAYDTRPAYGTPPAPGPFGDEPAA